MLVLDTVNKSITVAMSGAAATTNPDFVTAYSDDNGTTFVEGSSDGALNGTSQVTLVLAPAASTRRLIKSIYIENKDTAAVTITVTLNSSSTLRTIAKVTLQVGDTWSTDGTTDTNGNIKTVQGAVSLTTGVTGILPIANGGTGHSSILTPTQTILTPGSGTYTPPIGIVYLRIRMCAGGGGGAGTNPATTSGTNGGDTTFGSAFLSCNGGLAGGAANSSINAPAGGGDINIYGGCAGVSTSSSNTSGVGGASPLGTPGCPGAGSGSPASGYGAGGSSALYNLTNVTGGSGGAYLEKLITSPAASYAYTVGAAGTGGTGAAWPGGNGAPGIIIIDEFYE